MATFIINKKQNSDIVSFYIPDDTTNNKPVTRIFIQHNSQLTDTLENILRSNKAEYALEEGSIFLGKLASLETKKEYSYLADMISIKFDFNDIGLLYQTIKGFLDEETKKTIYHYVNNVARPFSSKRYHDRLFNPKADAKHLRMMEKMLQWYDSLKLHPSVTVDEKTQLLQLKTLTRLFPQNEAKVNEEIAKLQQKYGENTAGKFSTFMP